MIPLPEHERLAASVCFSRDVDDANVAMLANGDALADERWRIYREMVRTRFRKVVLAAFPRTTQALGDQFDPRFTAWLDEAPPDTRFFREVPAGFARHLGAWLTSSPSASPSGEPLASESQPNESSSSESLSSARSSASLPSYTADLARFEIARWRVLAAPDDPPAQELSFERPPQLTRSLKLLDVAHSVHTKKGAPKPGVFHLAIYRAPKDDAFEAVTLELNELARDLLRAWSDPSDAPLAARVQAVTQSRGTAIDERFLDGLGTLLEDLLRRGVVLGSR